MLQKGNTDKYSDFHHHFIVIGGEGVGGVQGGGSWGPSGTKILINFHCNKN